MDLKLAGKLALVSGSTAGIGFAIAETLAAEGARVIVNGRSQASVDAAIGAIRKSTSKEVLGFAGDLSQGPVSEALVGKHPGIEILVNNLGIFEAVSFENISDADWVRFFEVNVLSGVRLARLVLGAEAVAPAPPGLLLEAVWAMGLVPARWNCFWPVRRTSRPAGAMSGSMFTPRRRGSPSHPDRPTRCASPRQAERRDSQEPKYSSRLK